jgi:hypothetical protein
MAGNTAIGILQTSVADHTATIEDLTLSDESQDTNISALDVRVTSSESAISTNSTALSTLDGRVTIAETGVGSNADDISTLVTDLSTLEGVVSGNTSGISTNSASLSTLDGRVTTAETSIATNTGDISTLDTSLTTLDGTVTGNTSAIASNTSSIGTHTGQISSLNTVVSGHTTWQNNHLDEHGAIPSIGMFGATAIPVTAAWQNLAALIGSVPGTVRRNAAKVCNWQSDWDATTAADLMNAQLLPGSLTRVVRYELGLTAWATDHSADLEIRMVEGTTGYILSQGRVEPISAEINSSTYSGIARINDTDALSIEVRLVGTSGLTNIYATIQWEYLGTVSIETWNA